MADPNTVARAYLALWNDADDASRAERIARGWREQARYADPMMTGEGHDGIADMITGARSQFPGHVFTLIGTPDGHGRFVRFSWTLAEKSGEPVAGGTDVVRLDQDGRIAEVIGFLESRAA